MPGMPPPPILSRGATDLDKLVEKQGVLEDALDRFDQHGLHVKDVGVSPHLLHLGRKVLTRLGYLAVLKAGQVSGVLVFY